MPDEGSSMAGWHWLLFTLGVLLLALGLGVAWLWSEGFSNQILGLLVAVSLLVLGLEAHLEASSRPSVVAKGLFKGKRRGWSDSDTTKSVVFLLLLATAYAVVTTASSSGTNPPTLPVQSNTTGGWTPTAVAFSVGNTSPSANDTMTLQILGSQVVPSGFANKLGAAEEYLMNDGSGNRLTNTGVGDAVYGTTLNSGYINDTTNVTWMTNGNCYQGTCLNQTVTGNSGNAQGGRPMDCVLANATGIAVGIAFLAQSGFPNATRMTMWDNTCGSPNGASNGAVQIRQSGSQYTVRCNWNNVTASSSQTTGNKDFDGQWHHIICSWDYQVGVSTSKVMTMYYDGVATQGNVSFTGTMAGTNRTAQFFMNNGKGDPYYGMADHFQVFLMNLSRNSGYARTIAGAALNRTQSISNSSNMTTITAFLPVGTISWHVCANNTAGGVACTAEVILNVTAAVPAQTSNISTGDSAGNYTFGRHQTVYTKVNFTYAESKTGFNVSVNGTQLTNATGNFSNVTTMNLAADRTFLWCVLPNGNPETNYTGVCWTQNIISTTTTFQNGPANTGGIQVSSCPVTNNKYAADNQTSSVGIMQFNNTGTGVINIQLKVNATSTNYAACAGSTNDPTLCTTLTTTHQTIKSSLAISGSAYIWLWFQCNGVANLRNQKDFRIQGRSVGS